MELADAIDAAVAAGPVGDTSQLATVTVVNGDGTVDVAVPGGTLPGVRRLAHYSPTVGDLVVVVRMATGDRYIPGKTA